jgi:hypothetical protein
LEGGPPTFGQDFSCPALLEDRSAPLPVPGCHRLWRAVPGASGSCTSGHWPDPRSLAATGGVASCFPFLRLVRWFSSPGSPPMAMDSPWDTPKGWVAPFGHPRITGRSPLPSAFRSVPRPSSPLGTKASTRCPSCAAPAPSPEHAAAAQLRQMSEDRCQMADGTEPDPQVGALHRRIRQRFSDHRVPGLLRKRQPRPMLAHRHAYPCSRSNLTPPHA